MASGPYDMAAYKLGAFGGTLPGVFKAALPLQYGPTCISILGQQAEYLLKVHLTVSRVAKAATAVKPAAKAAIGPSSARGAQFGIFDMEASNAVGKDSDKIQIIQPLEQEMAGIIGNTSSRVHAGFF